MVGWLTRPGQRLAVGGLLALVGGVLLGLLAVEPSMIRFVLAGFAVAIGLVSVISRPAQGVLWLFAFLPFLGFLRRLLIPVTGWSGTDPMLLISPVISGALLAYWRIRPTLSLNPTFLSRATLILLVVSLLQILNPFQGGVVVGLAGAVVMIPPILWFFVGRTLGDDLFLGKLLIRIQVIGVLVAVYGLYQTNVGFLPFERQWIADWGYSALSVRGVVRAFSTFSSSAEFAHYVAIAATVSVSRAIAERLWHLLPLVIYLPAIFLQASRGVILQLGVTLVMLFAMRSRSRKGRILRLLIGGATVLLLGMQVLETLEGRTFGNIAPLIEHQVKGLLNPLDESQSTASIHAAMVVEGIIQGFRNPIGQGIGAITLAPEKFGGTGANFEIDFSNAFYALGLIGGLAYLATVGGACYMVWSLYRCKRTWLMLAATGVLLVEFGQWWNGGHYVTSPLVWFVLGSIDRTYIQTKVQRV